MKSFQKITLFVLVLASASLCHSYENVEQHNAALQARGDHASASTFNKRAQTLPPPVKANLPNNSTQEVGSKVGPKPQGITKPSGSPNLNKDPKLASISPTNSTNDVGSKGGDVKPKSKGITKTSSSQKKDHVKKLEEQIHKYKNEMSELKKKISTAEEKLKDLKKANGTKVDAGKGTKIDAVKKNSTSLPDPNKPNPKKNTNVLPQTPPAQGVGKLSTNSLPAGVPSQVGTAKPL